MKLNALLSVATISLIGLSSGFVSSANAQVRTDLTIGLVLEPPHFDPTSGAAAAIDEVVYSNVFEGLTKFGARGEVLPGLAKEWVISEDGKTYTFTLQGGVTFHDGSALSAADVVFSFERALAEDSVNPQKALFADIAGVRAIDELTVEVSLSRPNGSLLFNLAWGEAVIVNTTNAETNATNPIGTGPFKFKNWLPGDRVNIEKYDSYWGEAPKLDSATFRFISDPTAAFSSLMAGDVDTFPNFPSPETVQIFEADPRFEVVVGTTEGKTIMAMNNKRAPLDDIRVREALSHAIDRQEIIDGAMFGYGTPIGTHFSPHNPAYIDLTALNNFDSELSKKLLSEAGVSQLQLKLALPPPVYARRGGEIIAARLREVGVSVEIVNMEWAQWLEQVFGNGDFDLTVISHVEPMDIEIYARDDYYFGYGQPVIKKIFEDLANTTDLQERDSLYEAAQRDVSENFVNAYLFQLAKVAVHQKGLKGMWENFPTPSTDLTQVYWE